jgi:hypothetical protein
MHRLGDDDRALRLVVDPAEERAQLVRRQEQPVRLVKWSDIPRRLAFSPATYHHALELLVGVGRVDELAEPAVAVDGDPDPGLVDRLAGAHSR